MHLKIPTEDNLIPADNIVSRRFNPTIEIYILIYIPVTCQPLEPASLNGQVEVHDQETVMVTWTVGPYQPVLGLEIVYSPVGARYISF